MQKFHTSWILISLAAISVAGCASRQAKNEEQAQHDQAVSRHAGLQQPAASTDIPESQSAAQSGQSPRGTTLGMNARLDALEAKLAALNEKLDATRESLDSFLAAHEPRASGTPQSAVDTVGTSVSAAPLASDVESGYVNDQAIQLYRKAEILLLSEKYPDAILMYSKFLEQYPDHVLAGSAQFHIGQAYFNQGQWQKADQEFQKVLTSYDRSTHVSDTLRLMATAEDHLGKNVEAARHRQQLSSLFANSPAAAQAAAAAPHVSANTTAPTESAPSSVAKPPGLDGPPPTAPNE